MEGGDEPRNLEDFAAVSHGISRAGPQDLAKFVRGKMWALYMSVRRGNVRQLSRAFARGHGRR